MTPSALDATLERARGQYHGLRYGGPGLTVERPFQATPARLDWRFAMAAVLVAGIASTLLLRDPIPGAAEDAQVVTPTPYDALAAARRQLLSQSPASPDRPTLDLFAMPTPPDRPSGFDRKPDLG